VIHIDRVRTNVDVVGDRTADAARAQASVPTAVGLDPVSRARFRALVLEVLRDHLRDLDRQGLA
jgi:hypothetical protein